MSTTHIADTLTPLKPVLDLPTPAFEPNGARFLLLRDEVESVTKDGIHIPQSAKETPRTGTVVQCGPDCKVTKRYDRIAYPPYCGSDLSIDKQKYLLLEESEILGWLR